MRRITRLFRSSQPVPRELTSNFFHLYLDMSWWGLYAGSTVTFLNVYAVRVGATPVEIGWLAAAPALITMLFSLPGGRLVNRLPATKTTAISAFLARFLFLGYALIPLLVPQSLQVKAIFIVTLVLAVPNTIVFISFNKFFVEAVPSEWRGMVVGRRNALYSIISFLTALLCGQILSSMAFPLGYEIVFAIGFLGGIMTVNHISRVKTTDPILPPSQSPAHQKRRLLPEVDGQARRYIKVVGLLFFFNTVNSMLGPLLPEFTVHSLRLTDGMISVASAVSSMLVFMVSLFVGRLTNRIGNRRGTAWGAMLLSVNTLILVFTHSVSLFLVSVVIGGIASGVLNAAQYNFNLDNVPLKNRGDWFGWNVLAGNASILVGSVVGPLIARAMDIPSAFLVFAVLRLLGGLMILWWG